MIRSWIIERTTETNWKGWIAHTSMISASFFLPSSPSSSMNLSVIFCKSSSPLLRSSSEINFSFSKSRISLCKIAADIADGNTQTLEPRMNLLGQIMTAILGERGQVEMNDLAVAIGVQAQVGGLDGPLDLLEGRRVSKGLIISERWFRHADGGQLHQRSGSIVIID